MLIRVALGVAFIAHGWAKLSDMGTTVGFFDSLGLAAPLAYLVAIVEFAGGLAILLGVFTKFAAILIACVMAVAMFKVKIAAGYLGGYELDLSFFLMALSLLALGAGKYRVGHYLRRKQSAPQPMM